MLRMAAAGGLALLGVAFTAALVLAYGWPAILGVILGLAFELTPHTD